MGTTMVRQLAIDFTEILRESLAPLEFHGYVPEESSDTLSKLYIMGFLGTEVVVAGYGIEAGDTHEDFVTRMLSLTQFFRKAWQQKEQRFFPPDVKEEYERHRATGNYWRRVA